MIDGLAFDRAKASAAFPDGIGHVTRPSAKRGVPGITRAAGGTAARWRTTDHTLDFITPPQRRAAEEPLRGHPLDPKTDVTAQQSPRRVHRARTRRNAKKVQTP